MPPWAAVRIRHVATGREQVVPIPAGCRSGSGEVDWSPEGSAAATYLVGVDEPTRTVAAVVRQVESEWRLSLHAPSEADRRFAIRDAPFWVTEVWAVVNTIRAEVVNDVTRYEPKAWLMRL
ncbi:hypothetical protein [Symbiobacterium terraclitae]|uniref:hypothetical protein n=1 Tax=Symbiobacterium terraclitae TaxID=557451 RepID=UPI0035B55F0E